MAALVATTVLSVSVSLNQVACSGPSTRADQRAFLATD